MHGLSHCLAGLLALSYPATTYAQLPQVRAADAANHTEPHQGLVTWDEHSIIVHGQRVMLFSGEFHPFRLPSPDLWLDVFQKISGMGYTAVSFYLDWALLEGEPGHVRTHGIFALEPFFEAAQHAGLYLIARPGPYINSETSGGGLPGWLQRIKGKLRSTSDEYVNSTQLYLSEVLRTIKKFQITHGGPIIMVQYENEYSISDTPESRAILPQLFVSGQALDAGDIATLSTDLFPEYMEQVRNQFEDAGFDVPLMVNDAVPAGNWAPGTRKGAADIYTIDNYPFPYGFTCRDPDFWPPQFWPASIINYTALHGFSPKTPLGIAEFQGGQPEAWGSVGGDACAAWINHEFERVIYKNNYATAVKIFNVYMTYGGTNWGNLGYPGGFTSYDSASMIAEDRTIAREKYSEAKLQANFFRVSSAYLTSEPRPGPSSIYVTNPNITVTRLENLIELASTNFYVVRHSNYNSTDTTPYKLTVDTSIGKVAVPQLGSNLTLGRRDSKIHVTDYDVNGRTLIYSSGEVFTWTKSANATVLVLYGGEGEVHEFAFHKDVGAISLVEGSGVVAQVVGQASVVQWTVSRDRQIVHFGCGLEVHLLWRNTAYDYWTLHDGQYHETAEDTFIVKAGYLLRNATLTHGSLYLTGDVNATTHVEVIASPKLYDSVYFNSKLVPGVFENGRWAGTVDYLAPNISFHDFNVADWSFIDSLPEIQPSYDDSLWTDCSLASSNNPRNLTTPTSLYAGDYGFHAGSLLYRGHFTANVAESNFSLTTQGGYAFGHSVWLNKTFVGSWNGSPSNSSYQQNLTLPTLVKGANYVLTILVDHMGMEQNTFLGKDMMKAPRGIIDYTLSDHSDSSIKWKITGNLGGEQYHDHARGPFNEGSMFAERQGFHLPHAPTQEWKRHSPLQGIPEAGVGFFYTSFDLNVPAGYDTPLSFVIGKTTTNNTTASNFRLQLFVNGFQFGKYINQIGPQTNFPVPEGVLNHTGTNFVGLTLWAADATGAKLESFALEASSVIQSGYKKPAQAPQPGWSQRHGAY